MEEEEGFGYDRQNTDFISLGRFELIEWLAKINYPPQLLLFQCFMMSVWPWLLLDMDSFCSWCMNTSSIKGHNNPELFPPHKPHNHVMYIYDSQACSPKNKCGYMDEDGCGSGGVWNILTGASLDNIFLSVYYWYCLQVVLCDVVDCWSAFLYWSLEQIEDI